VDAPVPQRAGLDRMKPASPLRRFVLAVLAWLPVCYFLWWWAAALWVWLPVHLAGFALTHLWPGLIGDYGQQGAAVEIVTRVLVASTGPSGQSGMGELVLGQEPMSYGYALPLYVGLVLATPVADGRRFGQLLLGVAVIGLAQAFGIAAETLKLLAFDSGDDGVAAITRAGLNRELIALCYQFGYLILPAVVPAMLWLGLNRGFIERLTGRVAAEPAAGDAGPSGAV